VPPFVILARLCSQEWLDQGGEIPEASVFPPAILRRGRGEVADDEPDGPRHAHNLLHGHSRRAPLVNLNSNMSTRSMTGIRGLKPEQAGREGVLWP
jgi:hypothetical protein